MRISSLLLLGVVALGCDAAHQTAKSLHETNRPNGSSESVSVSKELTSTESAKPTLEKPTELKVVSLKVDGMSCPHGCYPSVRDAIAQQKSVDSIELVPQKVADVIDNPIVTVKYHGDFDVRAAMAAISDAGFEKVEVVTN